MKPEDRQQCVLIQDWVDDTWYCFTQPEQVIEATELDQVAPALRRAEEMVNGQGMIAAGFISYEAAPAFDTALQVRATSGFPLLWFGIFTEPEVLSAPPSTTGKYCLGDWTASVSRSEYDRAIARIKTLIARGETYQVNYTFRLRAPFEGDALALFTDLMRAQKAKCVAFVDTGRYAVCSASPELFFRMEGDRLESRPMKGTAARGRTLDEDEAQVQCLRDSEKDRAENLMIVDMVRNDMGRVAEIGSVRVPGLFEIEKYPTVWQMTSTVTAQTKAEFSDIVAALFPCASITGAPKPHTTGIIAHLETTPRRIYTGAVGFLAPGRRAQFNVAIRTVLIDRAQGRAEYGVGGGITWDSNDEGEYAECMAKAQILKRKRPEYSLLETMLWTPDEGYFLLDYHLSRLSDSAAYFEYPVEEAPVRERLRSLADTLERAPHRVRLLASEKGEITCQAHRLPATSERAPVRIRLAKEPVDSADPFLYHKTTNRAVYETAAAAHPQGQPLKGLQPFKGLESDVLLWNERGEITESCIANVVVEIDGEMLTPPVECGLLAGTFRAWLLEQKKVREEIVRIEDLRSAAHIFLINSVQKWRRASL